MSAEELCAAIEETWVAMQKGRPLIHCVTNRVTPQRVADVLLASGASPAMADNWEEVGQFAAIASCVYVNTGVHETQIRTLDALGNALGQGGLAAGKPAVLDPVGVGATSYRNDAVRTLLSKTHFDVIRANASEMRALAGKVLGIEAAAAAGTTRGVDATDTPESAVPAANEVSKRRKCAVAVSGERDYVVSAEEGAAAWISGGSKLLTLVTGCGCALGALVGACLAGARTLPKKRWSPAFLASCAAHAAYAIASERAEKKSAGPGTFSVHFVDELYALKPSDLRAPGRIALAPLS
eukprot:tig00020704_g13162.t1